MKKIILAAVMCLGFVGTAQAAEQQKPGKEVMIGISDAFVPGGFDSRSDAFVVVNGMFPNGCYQWKRADVQKLPENVIEIRSFAQVQSGLCLMVLTPFTKEVRIGQLPTGEHKIRFVNGDDTYLEKTIKIE